ncbi:MAG: helix-turn-helix domain-containing protein [Marinibacterium sp.]
MTAPTLNRFEWLKAVLQVEGLSATAKAAAAALAVQFYNDDTGQVNPRQETLAGYLKVHKDTVKRSLRELRNAGWLMQIGNGGRGRTPVLRFLSPSKIVPFRAAKGGKITPDLRSERGADLHPKAEKRGADLQQKGGGIIPPQYEQSSEQKRGSPAFKAFRNHRFMGNPFEGPCLVPREKWEILNPWNDWLRDNGFPGLCNLPVSIFQDNGGMTFFSVPFSKPPQTERQRSEAREYFSAMADAREVQHAAQ